MKYRIKIIEKNNGEQKFIPQYRKENWYILVFFGIVFSPLWLILTILCVEDKINFFAYFFYNWKNVFENIDGINVNRESAQANIKAHKENYEKELFLKNEAKKKRHEENIKRITYENAGKTKKIIYEKIK